MINSKVVWRDHRGKRYASFYAEVVVSESDQGRPVEDWDNIELRHVPVLHAGETVVDDGAELPPPDQRDLLPPDPHEFPRTSVIREPQAVADARDQNTLDWVNEQVDRK